MHLPRITLAVTLLLAASYVAQSQEYYPAQSWETRSPQDVGLNAEQLQQAVDFAQANEYEGERDLKVAILKGFAREPYHEIKGPTKDRGGPAGVILKNGYIVAQWGDVDRVDMTFSVTKSYLSTMAGLAVDEGLIESVDDSVKQYVWDGSFAGEHNSKVTWSHLLTQSSDWSGSLFNTSDWADRPPSEGGVDDWKYRDLNEPGTTFEYNDVRVNLLAYSLLQVWRKPLPMVLKEKIMEPIGASTTWRWYGYDDSFVNVDGVMMQSVSGGGHSGGGVFISTLDHARFGLLFLRKGQWNGEQLVSRSWIEEATQPSQANDSYGYMWWLNEGNRAWENVSTPMYYAAGFGGNFIVVDNEHDMVIVTRWLNPSQIGEMIGLVTAAVE